MRAAGLNPWKWLVTWDNKQYLYLVDKGFEQRKDCIIDKVTRKVVGVAVSGQRTEKEPWAVGAASGR